MAGAVAEPTAPRYAAAPWALGIYDAAPWEAFYKLDSRAVAAGAAPSAVVLGEGSFGRVVLARLRPGAPVRTPAAFPKLVITSKSHGKLEVDAREYVALKFISPKA